MSRLYGVAMGMHLRDNAMVADPKDAAAMLINADKPQIWKRDIAASVDLYNSWFLEFAPKAYRDTRIATTDAVEQTLRETRDLTAVSPEALIRHPQAVATLRMATCPPIARDRLIGLADVNKNLVKVMEEGRLPVRMRPDNLRQNLQSIIATVTKMLDGDIFPWIGNGTQATEQERHRASTIVADRLCGAVSDPIVRNAQERRQLALIDEYLTKKGYRHTNPDERHFRDMPPGTFGFRSNVVIKNSSGKKINIPIDAVIQPRTAKKGDMPVLIEAKSAGDFTNTNKRRKEEATKVHQLRTTYGNDVQFVLFLCGYFDSGYLGYEAAEGIDWVWEHRIEDLDKIGL